MLTLTKAPIIARIVRGLTIELREREYVAAAKMRGESPLYIMLVEILPNARGPFIVDMCLRTGYNVVIIGSPNVNPGYKLFDNATYPQIAEDYERMWRVLKSLPCDLFLGAHGGYFGLEEKYPLRKDGGADPFVDPDGYKRFITQKEQDFRAELAKQKLGAK